MSAEIGSLFASLSLEASPFITGMARAKQATESTMSGIRQQAGLTERSVNSVTKSFSQSVRPYSLIAASQAFDQATSRAGLLRGALIAVTAGAGGFGAALSTNVVLRYADTFTQLQNQLSTTSASMGELRAQFEAIQGVSERSRSGIEATTTLFSRLSRAAPQSNTQELLRYVETIQKALQLGGATGQEARSASIQFSQAVAANKLQGQDLRSILETPLGLQLAKGLHITIGELRDIATSGKLTLPVLFKA